MQSHIREWFFWRNQVFWNHEASRHLTTAVWQKGNSSVKASERKTSSVSVKSRWVWWLCAPEWTFSRSRWYPTVLKPDTQTKNLVIASKERQCFFYDLVLALCFFVVVWDAHRVSRPPYLQMWGVGVTFQGSRRSWPGELPRRRKGKPPDIGPTFVKVFSFSSHSPGNIWANYRPAAWHNIFGSL